MAGDQPIMGAGGGGRRLDPAVGNRLSQWTPLHVVDRLYFSGFTLNIDINE